MIKPEEIIKITQKSYIPFLKSWLKNEVFFPLPIRSNKLLDKDFVLATKQIEILFSESKNKIGIGYTIFTKEVNTKKMGTQSLPDRIEIETQQDFLHIISKKDDFEVFKTEVQKLKNSGLDLNHWMEENPEKIIEKAGKWAILTIICHYFLQNPKPNKYLRELPIDIHTKFIESNQAIITSLLDYLLVENINKEEKTFEKRLHLKQDIELKDRIRLRFLDTNLYVYNTVSELVLLPLEFENLDFKDKKVFIIENKINYLTFSAIQNGIVIFGKGFAVSALANATWLNQNQLYYWGDIDAHGFEILSQIRGYFNNTIALLMDKKTFEANQGLAKKEGQYSNKALLSNLSTEENVFFQFINENRWRLEQEKIPFDNIVSYIKKL